MHETNEQIVNKNNRISYVIVIENGKAGTYDQIHYGLAMDLSK